MLIIPFAPKTIRFPIGRLWNGVLCPDTRLSALVELQQVDQGIFLKSSLSTVLDTLKRPLVSSGRRLEGMEDGYTFLSLFFVEEGGQYLEITLEAHGTYRMRGFDGVRNPVTDFSDVSLVVNHKIDTEGFFLNEVLLPWSIFPQSLNAINIFFQTHQYLLAYHPLPGKTPDVHQIQTFPFLSLEP